MSRLSPSGALLAAVLALAGGALLAVAPEPAPRPLRSEPPNDARRALELGHELLLAGDEAAAEAAYREAVALDASNATAHFELGRLTLEHGRRFEARRELKRALELAPEHAEAHYFLGVAYDRLGLDRWARKSYRRAFELDPALTDPFRHPEVARNRQALAAMLADWSHDDGSTTSGSGASPVAAEATRAEAERSLEAPRQEKAASESGGYARATGSGDRSAPGEPPAGEAPSSAQRPREQASGGRRGSANGSTGGAVIDSTNLRGAGSVNQLGVPGAQDKGRVRAPATAPRTAPRGTNPRLAPTPRPFQPSDDSTGRVEPRLEAPDARQFAIAG